jgi:PPM family protein phosphatase
VTVLRSGSVSDPGMVRSTNQDAVLEQDTAFAVCDGMGGYAGGEVASAAAVAALGQLAPSVATAESLRDAVLEANRAVLAAGEGRPELAGMGTTCVVAVLVGTSDGDRLLLANVGDSRGYLFRRGELSQVTVDHSIVAQLIREGLLEPADAPLHPQRHVITRVLGMEGPLEVDLFELRLLEGDRVLLCSDGLVNELDDEELTRVLANEPDARAAAQDLVRRANANGGADNISVVVVDVLVADELGAELAPSEALAEPPASEAPGRREGWLARRRRLGAPRLLTLRTLAFGLLLGALVVGGWLFLRWFADSQYYVTAQGQSIVIYQGRPGGTLWFKPRQVEVTKVTLDQVLPIRRPALAGEVTEPSLAAAEAYVRNLASEFQQAHPTTTTTTTTAGS